MGMTFGNVQAGLQRVFRQNTNMLNSSLEKLSTGYRINKASDDAAGLSISEHLLSQISGYEQGIRNSQDGYSMLSVAEGATSNISENLQRIRELAVQAANGTMGSSERAAISLEINQRLEDIDRISGSTEFNSKKLLNGSTAAVVNLQIGPDSGDTLDIGAAFGDAGATALGMPSAGSVDISSSTYATNLMNTVDDALDTLNTRRSSIGAYQNRLDSVIDNLSVTSMNVASANSRIRDTDIAAESSKMVRYQLLQQADIKLMSQLSSMIGSVTLGLLG